jgi:hypothetical protein
MISLAEAKQLMQSFLTRFKGIYQFIQLARRQCEEREYSETLLGRRRYLPEIRSKNVKMKMRAQRQAVNSICQGSAADLVKVSDFSLSLSLLFTSHFLPVCQLAMININHQLERLSEKRKYPAPFHFHSPRSNPGGALYRALDDARLVLQV